MWKGEGGGMSGVERSWEGLSVVLWSSEGSDDHARSGGGVVRSLGEYMTP